MKRKTLQQNTYADVAKYTYKIVDDKLLTAETNELVLEGHPLYLKAQAEKRKCILIASQ